ncbi:MAG TPA: amino acid permease [Pyrinomonadaceae bacterium]|jgi:APA family basic amino acid/polyamine antiporter|nr:amino acid permease [Pyrinomonadaceae bacterium]
MAEIGSTAEDTTKGFVRGLGLWDSTMIVAGSMIGSGIFIVSADIAKQTGSPGGLLLTWLITGILTIFAALSYGELAAMMPKAGGQYIYLRESYSPLWGFLYGWTLFLVIQTGTIAAVAVAFSRFVGLFVTGISADAYIVSPIHISSGYAISLNTQQLLAILMILFLTIINTQGLALGKWIQNIFTSAKTLSLLALVVLGILIGGAAGTFSGNMAHLFEPQNVSPIKPDFSWLPTVTVNDGILGLIVAFGVAQVGSLFSSDAWNNITFTAGEVKDPKRNIPLSLAMGTGLVIGLYFLANLAYLCTLSLQQIQTAPSNIGGVGTLALQTIFGPVGATIMAVAIIVSTFGCNNGLVLAGARVYYAMAKTNLFFKSTGKLNRNHVPEFALILQCIWASLLVLPRTVSINEKTHAVTYGNLYNDLLGYVIFAVLIFYILTIIGIFILRKKRPDAERPYKAFGYPFVPLIYIVGAATIAIVLLFYQTNTSWPGLAIVLTGVPVYFIWRSLSGGSDGKTDETPATEETNETEST